MIARLIAAVSPTPEDCITVGTAQDGTPLLTPQQICGPLKGVTSIADIVSILLSFLLPLAGIILFFVIVIGGFEFMRSGGEPAKVQAAWAKITAGLIGIGIIIGSLVISRIVSSIFGLPSIL